MPTNIDPAIVEAVRRQLCMGVPDVECDHIDGVLPTCERDAEALVPVVAAAIERGIAEGERRMLERVEASFDGIALVLARRHRCLEHAGPRSGPCRTDRERAALIADHIRAALATAAPTACTERLGSLPCTGEHHPTHTYVGTTADDRGTRNAEGTP